ncbi:TetR/AcrR family transcriptional regulator [Amycolatopsis benzoatilytica]|uniref:TetR/AcrR family transcriptional regulator n=1 Tax=Amycolatopsis benzoatilytica TaxID=346045 RepID=UPI00036FAEAD|nr:TetR/AcrR family transcriptional regulator [Amycolatopsis benzoatilytica]
MTGLRERKKLQTRTAISKAAIALFLRSGFDRVSVAEVAEAAEVSKRTLFKYFPTKEDLVLHRFADHETETARVVLDRAAGETPLAALHRFFLDRLAERDPAYGLCDDPEVLAFYRMVSMTDSLRARLKQYGTRGDDALTDALRAANAAQTTAHLAARQINRTLQVLVELNWRQLAEGRCADDLYPEAVANANHAFDLLRGGLGDHFG